MGSGWSSPPQPSLFLSFPSSPNSVPKPYTCPINREEGGSPEDWGPRGWIRLWRQTSPRGCIVPFPPLGQEHLGPMGCWRVGMTWTPRITEPLVPVPSLCPTTCLSNPLPPRGEMLWAVSCPESLVGATTCFVFLSHLELETGGWPSLSSQEEKATCPATL